MSSRAETRDVLMLSDFIMRPAFQFFILMSSSPLDVIHRLPYNGDFFRAEKDFFRGMDIRGSPQNTQPTRKTG